MIAVRPAQNVRTPPLIRPIPLRKGIGRRRDLGNVRPSHTRSADDTWSRRLDNAGDGLRRLPLGLGLFSLAAPDLPGGDDHGGVSPPRRVDAGQVAAVVELSLFSHVSQKRGGRNATSEIRKRR